MHKIKSQAFISLVEDKSNYAPSILTLKAYKKLKIRGVLTCYTHTFPGGNQTV